LLPCLFSPDFGMMARTDLGVGELTDYLIGPFIVLLYLAGNSGGRGAWRSNRKLMICLLAWALLSALTIDLRYGYARPDNVWFSLVKVGKLTAYGVAGVLTARALEQDRAARLLFPWAVLASCLVVAATLIFFHGVRVARDAPEVAFVTRNGMSVALAIMYCWMTAYWLTSVSSRVWCAALALASPILLVGFFLSDGRGGWVAAIVGGAYVALRFGIRPSLVVPIMIGLASVVATYQTEEGFRTQIDMTLDPSKLNQQSDFASTTGIDDGSRVDIWLHEAPRVFYSPVLGTGLFHRGGLSLIWPTGSHNFWLQMFLETGIVGGAMVLMVFRRMWQAAGSRWAESAGVSIPARAGLVAAFVGGMSGEYFYGGKPLLALFLVAAPILSLPFESSSQVRNNAHARIPHPASSVA
jgi:hypothetical protein